MPLAGGAGPRDHVPEATEDAELVPGVFYLREGGHVGAEHGNRTDGALSGHFRLTNSRSVSAFLWLFSSTTTT